MAPTEAQRAVLRQHAGELAGLTSRTPENDEQSLKATSMVVMGMIKALSGKKLDAGGAEALVDGYLDALEDLPSWSVDAAVRRWNRGDCGPDHDYAWRPSPAELRVIANEETWKVLGRAHMLLALADSMAEKEFTPEHRAAMVEKLQQVFRALLGSEDVIDRVRREHRERSAVEHAARRKQVLKEIEADERRGSKPKKGK